MSDIIVTTPKGRMADAAREAAECIAAGGGEYFRRFPLNRWPALQEGERVYYVEDGYVRGFAIVDHVELSTTGFVCQTTGAEYGPGFYAWMHATSWQWIRPIPMTGFQSYRYACRIHGDVEIVGGWLDPKPQASSLKPQACRAGD